MKRPSALAPGATIALVAPAGPLAEGTVERATERVERWGWRPWVGRHARGRFGYLAAPDAERLADFNAALRDPRVDAVWCLRGGYGTLRILPQIDWPALAARPRALIGFSDNTALHLAAQRAGVVSFHGPHPATPQFSAFSEQVLLGVLTRPEPAGVLPFPAGAAPAQPLAGGVAEGPLVGGNLSLLAATLGTPYQLRAEGAILFLEEIGEPVYRVDRMLTQLRLAGALDGIAGVALGAFSECPDDGDAALPSTLELLRDRLADLGAPVAVGFPFGHVDENWTLPLGVRARLDADRGTLALLEPAVAE